MNNQPIKDPKGGLTAAGRKLFAVRDGANLKPGVKDYASASLSDKKRWISWALRFYGQKTYPPLKKPNGEPTRFALTAAAWGEPVPETEADARKIAAKARARQEEINRQEVSKKSTYTKPELRERLKQKIMAGSKGGKPGQWSARKSQLLQAEYEREGGGYSGPKTANQQNLTDWTAQDWTTSSGKPSDGKRRYLPADAWDELTPEQIKATNAKKAAGNKRGKQFVPNTDKSMVAASRVRNRINKGVSTMDDDVIKRRGGGRPGPNPKSSGKEIVGRHGHRPHTTSILWPALYEHLRAKGHSKAAAAAISNGQWNKKHGRQAKNLMSTRVTKKLPVVGEKTTSASLRAKMAAEGEAMPDGSFPIASVNDLVRAVRSYGRAKDQAAVKKHIINMAKKFGRIDLLPKDWQDTILKASPDSKDVYVVGSAGRKKRSRNLKMSAMKRVKSKRNC